MWKKRKPINKKQKTPSANLPIMETEGSCCCDIRATYKFSLSFSLNVFFFFFSSFYHFQKDRDQVEKKQKNRRRIDGKCPVSINKRRRMLEMHPVV